MNLQLMLLVGVLLGNNVETEVRYYENIYREDYKQKQENIYLEQVKDNDRDVEALTELANYYEDLWRKNPYDFDNFNKAETVYKEIIEINPKSTALAKFYLDVENAVGYYCMDENGDYVYIYKKAEDECLRLLEIDSDNVEVMIILGDVYNGVYQNLFNDNQLDGLTHLDFFDKAEKIYFDVLKMDENNIEVRYKLIDLYENESENEWKFNSYSQGIDYIEYFKQIEQQYLDILKVDEDYIQARYDLINLYLYAYSRKDIDCIDKMENQFLEISKRETKEEANIEIPMKIGDTFNDIWIASNYTDNEAFEKAEYYYNYALSIKPDNSDILYNLINIHESDYYYGNGSSEENFQKREELYNKYLATIEIHEQYEILFDIGNLYEDKWLLDKSDYTYYYKAENEFNNALELKLALDTEEDDIYWKYDSLEICMSLVGLYTTKYEFDGDTEAINTAKNLLLEQIETTYADEVRYMNSDTKGSYVDEEKLKTLGVYYYYLWELDTDDMQYYEKAEKTFLKALEIENDYWILVSLAELYISKYELDTDIDARNNSKNIILEQISNAYSYEISGMDEESQDFYMDTKTYRQLANLYYLVWKLDTSDIQYYEKSEKVLLKSLDIKRDYFTLIQLGELYTERWLLDKSNVEYKLKAIECFDEILADDNELLYGFWLKKSVYPLLEKLEM